MQVTLYYLIKHNMKYFNNAKSIFTVLNRWAELRVYNTYIEICGEVNNMSTHSWTPHLLHQFHPKLFFLHKSVRIYMKQCAYAHTISPRRKVGKYSRASTISYFKISSAFPASSYVLSQTIKKTHYISLLKQERTPSDMNAVRPCRKTKKVLCCPGSFLLAKIVPCPAICSKTSEVWKRRRSWTCFSCNDSFGRGNLEILVNWFDLWMSLDLFIYPKARIGIIMLQKFQICTVLTNPHHLEA